MAHELDDLSRLLGNLEGTIGNFGRQLADIDDRMQERDSVLTDIQIAATNAANDIRYLKDVIAKDIKPVTDDVKRWRLMGVGVITVAGIAGAAIMTWVPWIWTTFFTHKP